MVACKREALWHLRCPTRAMCLSMCMVDLLLKYSLLKTVDSMSSPKSTNKTLRQRLDQVPEDSQTSLLGATIK